MRLAPGQLGVRDATAAGGRCDAALPAIDNRNVCTTAAYCGDDDSGFPCVCAKDANGESRCVDITNAYCPEKDQCDSNGDCGRLRVCIKVGACCRGSRKNLCVPKCGVVAPSARSGQEPAIPPLFRGN